MVKIQKISRKKLRNIIYKLTQSEKLDDEETEIVRLIKNE